MNNGRIREEHVNEADIAIIEQHLVDDARVLVGVGGELLPHVCNDFSRPALHRLFEYPNVILRDRCHDVIPDIRQQAVED